ncbi:MbtH family protein [Streptomyces sp. NPDC092296]|uniref:MbtH family protein n=1 Tax=Streptomyces sp. NPDC092296 TaxID=3366012 RepID=UPI00381F303B
MSDTAVDRTYQVVVNDEEQYSIWEAHREPPAGWRAAGFTGGREQCLEHIASVWTDLRPLSVRGEQRPASIESR